MFTYQITNERIEGARTEILYAIESARATNEGVLRLLLSYTDEAMANRQKNAARRTLRDLKKRGRVSFFIATDEMKDGSTEARFLINKYPALDGFEEKADAPPAFFVKL